MVGFARAFCLCFLFVYSFVWLVVSFVYHVCMLVYSLVCVLGCVVVWLLNVA